MTHTRPLPPTERRALLIAAARQLILDHDPEVTARQVAETAKMAEGTLLRAFPTQRDPITATIVNHLSPGRLADILAAIPITTAVDEATEMCLPIAANYATTSGRFIPRPHRGGDQDEIRFRAMELWEAQTCDIAG